MNLRDKKIAVIGLGKSGFAAAKFLMSKKARVCVTDGSSKKEVLESAEYLRSIGIATETGGHTEGFLRDVDMIVTSPGVPKDSLPLEWARRKKVPVISEIELAFYFCQGTIVGVTGSNGKTTTCNLIHRVLTDGGKKSVLCGNVGFSFLEAISEIDEDTIVVLELSSFQLEDSPTIRPHVAVVLNVSPNHLDRHKTLESYTAAKEMIFRNQKKNDHLILNYDDLVVRAMAKKTKSQVVFYSLEPLPQGIYAEDHFIKIKNGKLEKSLLDPAFFQLKGAHNLQNIMAVAAVGMIFKIPKEKMQKSLNSFQTLHHRIEPLGEVKGVRFVNDSKSTTVESTRAAIKSVDGPLILVAGGRDKGAPFQDLSPLIRERVRKAVLYGEAREKIAGVWGETTPCLTEKSFADAIKLAYEEARPGDTVLLSPMCTSFDQFSSYEERGETFRKLYQEIESQWTR